MSELQELSVRQIDESLKLAIEKQVPVTITIQQGKAWINFPSRMLSVTDKRVLIAQRPEGKQLAGLWEFPGGKADEGESPREALAREIREELGAEISVGNFLVKVEFENKDELYSVLAYNAVFDTTPAALGEHDEIRWLPFKDIAELDLAGSDREIYEKLKLKFG